MRGEIELEEIPLPRISARERKDLGHRIGRDVRQHEAWRVLLAVREDDAIEFSRTGRMPGFYLNRNSR